MNIKHTLKFWNALAWLLTFAFLVSCQEDEPQPITKISNTANNYVNSWIYENMEYWYLWSDKLPADPDKNSDPESFFNSLLYSGDRFSWIQSNYRDLLNSLQGITTREGRTGGDKETRKPLAHSLDFKRRGFSLIVDENIPAFLTQ